jgi:hypothetical protein
LPGSGSTTRGELELDGLSRRVEVVLSATYLNEAAAGVADLPQIAGFRDPTSKAIMRV